ncbi:Hypothetical predicted protein [Cloeon dipterum]|uniref:GPI mannosyltransferase 2 n=1 Tax=Cloeon dipterum TaxID=197152 RepID=A0A8S1D4U4_9INSE|nr:Hypothetical predicted protein [Cloeon dipterum]
MERVAERNKIRRLAITSRIAILSIQCLASNLLPHHETDVFEAAKSPLDTPRPLDPVVSFLFGGLMRWDGQYFLHVARHGYTYLNTLAFFPLLPMAGSFLASLASPLTVLLSPPLLLLLLFTGLNFYCFVRAALALYDLTAALMPIRSILPYRAAVLFCLSPASIFFSAPYSESLFAMLTFSGLARLNTLQPFPSSALLLALSTACRSNGLLNLLHPIHQHLRFRRPHLALLLLLVLPLPFILFQIFSYGRFCLDPHYSLPLFLIQHAQDNEYLVAGGTPPPPFCLQSLALPYQYVQSSHWQVGFLRYFEWKQLPNFLLAAPLLFLVISCGWRFFLDYTGHCLTLGLSGTRHKLVQGQLPAHTLPMVVHAVFLALFCFFCIHVQVDGGLKAAFINFISVKNFAHSLKKKLVRNFLV